MGWPLSQDYNEAVQSPATSFFDPDLKGGEVVPGPMGLPLPRSGNFADVYQMRGAGGTMWAVKLFTRQVQGLQERYLKIDAVLRQAKLPFTVGFEFQEKGVRIKGIWYPLLKMEWVEGFTLNEFVRQNADKPEYLRALLGLWVRLSKRLRDANIAHADLQHGNVLLVPGSSANKLGLKLIDYDGMWIPSLAGKPSGEVGHPAYQHPGRLRDRIYSADVDRFPHLAIACALRATAVAGKKLWDQFDNGDNLLFREPDFADPAKAPVWKALWALDDPTVTNLVALVVDSTTQPLALAPWVDEVLIGDKAAAVNDTVLARAAERIGVASRAVRKAAQAQLFIPEQANEFADLGGSDESYSPSYRRKQKKSSLVPALAIGAAILVVGAIIGGVMLSRGKGTNSTELKEPPPLVADIGKSDPLKPPIEGEPKIKPIDEPGKVPIVKPKKEPDRPIAKGKWKAIPLGSPADVVCELTPALSAKLGSGVLKALESKKWGTEGVWFCPDGLHVLHASKTEVIRVNLQTGSTEKLISGGDFARVAATTDTKHVITAGADHWVRCWNTRGRANEVWSHRFGGPITALVVTPDGERVAVSGTDVGYAEFGIERGDELRRSPGLRAEHLAFDFARPLALAAHNDIVELWSLDDGRARTLATNFTATALCVTRDGFGVAAGTGRTLKVWTMFDGRDVARKPIKFTADVSSLVLASDQIYAVTDGSEIVFFQPTGGSKRMPLQQPPSARVALAVTTMARHAIVSRDDGPANILGIPDSGAVAKKDSPPGAAGPGFKLLGELDVPLNASISISPDGDRLMTLRDTKIVIRDAKTLAEIDNYKADKGHTFVAACFGPGTKIVVTDQTLDRRKPRTHWRDLAKKQNGPDFTVPPNHTVMELKSIANSPWVIVGTDTDSFVYEVDSGKVVPGSMPSSSPTTGPRTRIHFVPSPDGQRVLGYGQNTMGARIWETATKAVSPYLEASEGIVRFAFTPDSKQIVGVGAGSRVRYWDAATGKFTRELDRDMAASFESGVPLSPELLLVAEGSQIVVETIGGRVLDARVPSALRYWCFPNASLLIAQDEVGNTIVHQMDVSALARRPEGRQIGPSRLGRIHRGSPFSMPVGMAYTGDGQKLVMAYPNGRVYVYSGDRLLYLREVPSGDTQLSGLVRARDKIFIHGPRIGVRVLDADTLEKVNEFPALTGSARSLVVTPDAKSFILITERGTKRVDVLTKEVKPIISPPKASGPLTQFAFSADGLTFAARWGGGYGAVFAPKGAGTGEQRLEEPAKLDLPIGQAMALSEDGKLVVVGTDDGRVTIWQGGKVKHTEVIHSYANKPVAVSDAAFLPNGRGFVTIGMEGTVCIWDESTLKIVNRLQGLGAMPQKILVHPSGQSIFVHSERTITLYDLP